MPDSKEEIRLDLTEGAPYILVAVNGKGEPVRVQGYKMVGLATHCNSGQEVVVYRSPTGRLMACTLMTFASRFQPVVKESAPVTEKVLSINEGSGY